MWKRDDWERYLLFDKKRKVPISDYALRRILDLWLSGLSLAVASWFSVGFVGTIVIIAEEKIRLLPYWILFLLIALGFILSWRHKLREKIKEENRKDYEKSQEILKVRDEFLANPPNLLQISDPHVIEEDGWRPIRVEYHLDQAIKAELAGIMRGQWAGLLVGSFWGTIEGEIAGKTAPKLFNESTFVLLQKENEIMRLISPSVETAREITYQVFDRLLNIYGKHSHSWLAVRTIGWGERFPWRKENQIPATKLLDNWEINPSHIHDRLMASLNLPLEERPTVKIQGIPLKEGIILGCTISLNQEPPKILFPLEFIRDLSRRLAPVAEKELLPKEPAKLLP